jgi:hypothetical protein
MESFCREAIPLTEPTVTPSLLSCQYVTQSLCSYTDNINPTEEDAEYGACPQATFAEWIELAIDSTNFVATPVPTGTMDCDHVPQKPNKIAMCQVCNMESKWFLSIKEWR